MNQDTIEELKNFLIELIEHPIPEIEELKDISITFEELAKKLRDLSPKLKQPAAILFLHILKNYGIF